MEERMPEERGQIEIGWKEGQSRWEQEIERVEKGEMEKVSWKATDLWIEFNQNILHLNTKRYIFIVVREYRLIYIGKPVFLG